MRKKWHLGKEDSNMGKYHDYVHCKEVGEKCQLYQSLDVRRACSLVVLAATQRLPPF